MDDSSSVMPVINYVHQQFGRTFLGGIPMLLNDGGAFLSFICMVSAVDALAGFRFPEIERNGMRFTKFVEEYFPQEYRSLSGDLWKLRNSLLHAFNAGPFALCHHQSPVHLTNTVHDGVARKTLNAEEFYAALVQASSAYFADLRATEQVQQSFRERLASELGGVPIVVPLK